MSEQVTMVPLPLSTEAYYQCDLNPHMRPWPLGRLVRARLAVKSLLCSFGVRIKERHSLQNDGTVTHECRGYLLTWFTGHVFGVIEQKRAMGGGGKAVM